MFCDQMKHQKPGKRSEGQSALLFRLVNLGYFFEQPGKLGRAVMRREA